jgi:hypothetical protein
MARFSRHMGMLRQAGRQVGRHGVYHCPFRFHFLVGGSHGDKGEKVRRSSCPIYPPLSPKLGTLSMTSTLVIKKLPSRGEKGGT